MDTRESHRELAHAVELAEAGVLDAWANLADAYATLQQADAQLRAYRSLFCGRPEQPGRAHDASGSSEPEPR